jgi:hypothetical protein
VDDKLRKGINNNMRINEIFVKIETANANVPEAKANEYQKGTNRDVAKSKLLDLIEMNGDKPFIIKNINDGEEAILSKSSVKKLVSATAVDKSVVNGFTARQHFAVASDIDELFRKSLKLSSKPDKNGNPDVVAMHRFAAPLFGSNVAYITVKEAKEHGKRIYTVELMEIGKLEGTLEEPGISPATSLTSNFPK